MEIRLTSNSESPISSFWDELYLSTARPLPWQMDHIPADIRAITGLIGANSRVLDVGCGTGEYSHFLANNGARVLGVDISVVAIKEAARAYPNPENLEFEVASISSVPGVARFELILLYSVLHHIPIDEWGSVARDAARLLAPGGRVLVICYSDMDPRVGGQETRVGRLGSVIVHPSRDRVVEHFEAVLTLVRHRETALGPAKKHPAHEFYFAPRKHWPILHKMKAQID
jgi:SAM-dependent methyltransferase